MRFHREVIRCEWVEGSGLGSGEILELWIEADAFMRNMVRVLVGTMLEVGGGRRPLADFEALLEGAPRRAAGETAPATASTSPGPRTDDEGRQGEIG